MAVNVHLSVVHVKARIGHAEEGVRRSDAHESDVVVEEDVGRVDKLLVPPDKIVELVGLERAVGPPAQHSHLGRGIFTGLPVNLLVKLTILLVTFIA